MKAKKDASVGVYGAGVIARQTAALRQEIDGVRAGQDIEYIHRMRVASRRLRTALAIFNDCLPTKKAADWQGAVRDVTRALGAARDADVQIELVRANLAGLPAPLRSGVRRLLLRLLQRRARLQRNVARMLDRMVDERLLEKIDAGLEKLLEQQGRVFLYTPALYALAREWITNALDGFLSYEESVNRPEDVAGLHAMRIAAKHLRYTLEAFAPIYADELKTPLQTLRKAQEALGDIHDCDVWIEWLPAFIEEERRLALAYYGTARPMTRLLPGLQHFQQRRQDVRDSTYTAFVKDWQKWKDKGVWERLRDSAQNPYQGPPAEESPSPTDGIETAAGPSGDLPSQVNE